MENNYVLFFSEKAAKKQGAFSIELTCGTKHLYTQPIKENEVENNSYSHWDDAKVVATVDMNQPKDIKVIHCTKINEHLI
jgi:hypothetical protein